MVKTLQLKLVLLLCMIMGAGTAWAEDFTLSSANEVTQNGITVSFAKGEGSTAPAWYSAGLRLYAKNTVTISSTNTITSITFNWEKQGSKAFASATANVGAYTHPSAAGEGTWTGSANEVVFTLGSSGQLQLNTFSVTVSSGSTPPVPTTYTVTFNAGTGTFVGNDDFPNTTNTKEAGSYTLPSATPASGYVFDGWLTTGSTTPVTGSYTVSDDVNFTASYSEESSTTGGSEEWVLTDLADLTSSDVFVIVGDNNGTYAMTNNNGTTSAPATPSVTISGGKITSAVTDNIKWNVSGNATNGYTFYPNGNTDTWLYCSTTAATSNNNNMRVGTGDRKLFELSEQNGDNYLVTKDSYADRYVSVYLASGEAQDWRGYTYYTTSQTPITFYKRVSSDPTKADPELSFSPATAEATFGQPFTAPTLNAATGFNGTVEYSSSVETVAQVMDTETGELRIVGGGTTVITATFAGNDDFNPGSASYTLTVTDNRIATTITQEDITIDIADVATLTQLTPVVKDANDNVVPYTNSPTAEGLPEVYFEIVSDDNGIFGSFDSHGNVVLNSVVGTATVKAVYNHFQLNENYRPSECTFTVTIESTLNGIAEFCEQTSGSTGTVRLTDAVVLYVNGKDMFVRDNTGAIDFYNTGLSYEAGNILNGKITAKYTQYNGMNELTTPISNNTIVATAGSAVTPTEITTSDAADNACNLVKLSGVTVTSSDNKFYVDGVQVYDKFKLNYTIEAGKTYDIVGIMIPYNSSYEICPTEAPVEEVVTTPVINANDVEMVYDATSGEIAYTITNPVPGTLLNATTTADWVSDINVEADKVTFTTTANEGTTDRTATFTLTYAGAADKTVTVTQGHYVAPAVDYATLPFEFDGGRADVAETDGLTQEGLESDYGSSPKLKFNGTDDWVMLKFNERPGTLTFDIKGNSFSGGTFTVQTSEDGVTFTDLESYTELGAKQSESFNNLGENVRYIKWIYTNKADGNVALGNIKLEKFEVPSNSAPAWSDLPTPTINVGEDYELDLATYVTGTPTPTISLDTEVPTSLYDFEDGYLIFQPTAAGTYQFTFTATNSEGSENATLTVTAVEPGAVTTYTLATAIEPGKHYIIVSSIAAGDGKAMGKQNNNNRAAEAVTISGDGTTSAITASVTGDDVHEFLICGPDANGRYTIFDESTENDGKDNGYLYAASSGSNHLKTQESNNVNSQWTISIDSESKVASIQADGEGSNSRNVMQFNSGSNLFSCYASASQGSVYLYVKDSEASTTVTRSVTIKADRQYTAFSSDVALDFTGTDLTAFLVTEATGTTRTVTKVPANTGVIVGLADVTTTQQVISVPVYTGTMDDVTDNMLVAVVTGKHIDQTDGDNTNYVFGKQGGKERFFKVNGTSGIDVPDNNAYLQIPTSLAKNLNVIEFGGDEATGINALETEALNGAIYNLQGQKVNRAQKGVYIVNGRKVVVK